MSNTVWLYGAFFFLGYNVASLLNTKQRKDARKYAIWSVVWVAIITLRLTLPLL